jgi:hypothetical protein
MDRYGPVTSQEQRLGQVLRTLLANVEHPTERPEMSLYTVGASKPEQDYIACPDCGDVVLNTLTGIDAHLFKEYQRSRRDHPARTGC